MSIHCSHCKGFLNSYFVEELSFFIFPFEVGKQYIYLFYFTYFMYRVEMHNQIFCIVFCVRKDMSICHSVFQLSFLTYKFKFRISIICHSLNSIKMLLFSPCSLKMYIRCSNIFDYVTVWCSYVFGSELSLTLLWQNLMMLICDDLKAFFPSNGSTKPWNYLPYR